VTDLRAADAFLEYAVRDTLNSLELAPEDEAAKQLAIRYARLIDHAINDWSKPDSVLWHLGPELLRCLESLGATPAARASIARGVRQGGDNGPAAVSRLDQLRTARTARRPAGA
jgi:hypothetical protein